ncbi:MAG: hypothetical protein P8P74_07050 [Crocinitomicaceae bacterium]|nr:hypothetical protein [Crocinitomicaceae bacterium]
MQKYSFLIVLSIFMAGCSDLPEEEHFDFFLDEPCMITNFEQNNLIEGTQLRVESCEQNTWTITLKLPKDFPINSDNCNKWRVGWGDRKPYYDAGVENLRWIDKIDGKTGTIFLGELMRGEGLPNAGQRIVFWNSEPSGYKKVSSAPVIHPNFWPDFNGESIGFSSIVFDKYRQIWITLVNEIDSDTIQTYAAISEDLVHWRSANKGKPVLRSKDFDACTWTSGDRTPIVSEIIQHKGKYYVFMDGEDKSGKRHIGIATADDLLGEYFISKQPILSPKEGTWMDQSVFCAKIAKREKDFILFFDGRNKDGYEQVGRATSTNLTSWAMNENPVLDQHVGWRSASFTSEPSYVQCTGDTVLLMAAGAKEFQESYWHHYITHRSYMDQSGNVNDAQLGAFVSSDGGKSFKPHRNNPVFVNDYSDFYENEHMGGNFEVIEKDSTSYIFYQAKSSSGGMKYCIFLRSQPL